MVWPVSLKSRRERKKACCLWPSLISADLNGRGSCLWWNRSEERKGNSEGSQRCVFLSSLYRPWKRKKEKRKWLTTLCSCSCVVYCHRCPPSLASLFRRCCFLYESGSAQSLSINKSDNCQHRQLFVTASLSWLTASCHSCAKESESYVLWLPSEEADSFAHESVVSHTVLWQFKDSSTTLRTCFCALFSMCRRKFRYYFPHRVALAMRNIKVISIIMKMQHAEIFRIMERMQNWKVDETFFPFSFFFFKYLLFQQLLESKPLRLWLWLLLLKITAWHLLNQSVSVLHTQFPHTYKLSSTLAFHNVLPLKLNLVEVSIRYGSV